MIHAMEAEPNPTAEMHVPLDKLVDTLIDKLAVKALIRRRVAMDVIVRRP